MRYILFIVLFICYSLNSFGQTNKVDSLLQVLSHSNQSNYRNIYNSIETELLKIDTSVVLKKLNEVQKISRDLRFKGPVVSAFRIEAIIYAYLFKDYVKAIQAVQEAYRLAQEYQLPVESANIQKLWGNIYQAAGRNDLALQNYLQAQAMYGKLGYKKAEAEVLYMIGNNYYSKQQYDLSKDYMRKAYQLGKDSLDKRTLISALSTIALAYRNEKEYAQAIEFQMRSMRLAQAARDSAWIGITNGNMGRLYELQGKYDAALIYYQINLSLSRKFQIWGQFIITLSSMANIHLHKKNYTTAKTLLDTALSIAQKEKEYDDLQVVYEIYARYYQQTNQIEKALAHQALYYQVKDSLAQKHFNTEVERIRSAFDLEKKQAEIELLKKDNEVIAASEQKKNIGLLATLSLLVCIVIFTVLLYRSDRQKEKANRQLIAQQRELFELNEEVNRQNEEIKDMNIFLEQTVQERTKQLQEALDNVVKQNQNLEQFAFIISHNLRSPIAHILGLVSIFNKHNIQDPMNFQIMDHLNKSAHNLDMIVNDLNDILLMRNLSSAPKEEVNLEEVMQLTVDALQEKIALSDAVIQTDFSQVNSFLTIKSYINSIFYNLLSNAIKYQSPDRNPEILIKTNKVDNFICLIVKDNGLGIDLTRISTKKLFGLYQRMHFHTEGKGVGLFIVKEQIDALNGKIEVESQPDQGCTFRIYFPA